MCTIMGKVCCGALPEKSSVKQRAGYAQEKRGILRTVRRWFSLYEIREPASRGGYLSVYGYGV